MSPRFFAFFVVFLTFPLTGMADTGASALPETLVQALTEAYENNATLQEQRAALRQTDENVPTAISGWRPNASSVAAARRPIPMPTPITAIDAPKPAAR